MHADRPPAQAGQRGGVPRRPGRPHRWHERMVRAYHLRSEDDPTQVITLGFFEGTEEELDAMRDSARVDGGRGAPAAADRAARGVRAAERRLERGRRDQAGGVSSDSGAMPEPVEQAPRAAARVLERGAQQVVEPERPVARARAARAATGGSRSATAALIVGGPKLRRAASTSSPSARRGAVRAIASSRCSLSMLPEPWRAASSRARISAARASGESAGGARWRRRGREVAIAAMGGLARDAERLRDRRERLACLQRARDVRRARARRARARSSVSARSDAVGSGAVSARSSSDRMRWALGCH